MTVEDSIFATLKSLVSNRVYRDIAPQNVTTLPRITFQQVGGESLTYLDGETPDLRLPRFQVNVWHSSRDAAIALAKQVDEAMRSSTVFQAVPLGEPIAVREDDTQLFGTIQDFRVAHT